MADFPEVEQPVLPRKMCESHDAVWALMGMACPSCKRKSLFAYDYD